MSHLYLHVPFCRRRCSYCDFQIAVRRDVPSRAFVEEVRAEQAIRGLALAPFETVYLGGGTPSLLDADALADLIAAFPRRGGAEVTIEANPEDVTPLHAASWRAAGVNRVSLGVQSFDPAVLSWMHRPHGPEAPAAAMAVLRDAGIANVSVDLIFALPSSLRRDLARDLDLLLALTPDHVSAYGLTVEDKTPLGRWVRDGRTHPAPDERYEAEFLTVRETLTTVGFDHYEISNYARAGRRARHNSAYWSGAEYVGLGPAAHGFASGVRRWNLGPYAAWARAVRWGSDPIAGEERPDDRSRALEQVYLGLRTNAGIPANTPSVDPTAVAAMLAAGWLTRKGDRLQATPAGWLRIDAIVPRLTTLADGG